MSLKKQCSTYKVVHRFRLGGRWIEASDVPIPLSEVAAQGPLSQGLIERCGDKKITKEKSAVEASN